MNGLFDGNAKIIIAHPPRIGKSSDVTKEYVSVHSFLTLWKEHVLYARIQSEMNNENAITTVSVKISGV